MEGDIVFAGNRKKFRPLTKAPSIPHPIGSKPVIRSHPEMSMPGPLHCFSADSLDSLQNFSDRVKSRQPTIEIVHDSHTGYILRDPDAELAAQRARILAFAERRFRGLLDSNPNAFITVCQPLDAERNGQITLQEFEQAIAVLGIGLSRDHVVALAGSQDAQQIQSGMVHYKKLAQKYSRGSAGSVRAREQLALAVSQEASIMQASKDAADRKRGRAGLAGRDAGLAQGEREREEALRRRRRMTRTVLLGFLVFPLWLWGFAWIRSKDSTAKRLGWVAIVLLSLYIIVAIVIAAVLVNRLVTSNPSSPPTHCPSRTGIMVSIRVTGKDAVPSAFWNQETGDVSKQSFVRQAVFALYTIATGTFSSQPQDSVILDDILPLFKDPDGATLQINMRIVAAVTIEAAILAGVVTGWAEQGQLLQALRANGLNFDGLYLSAIVPDQYLAPGVTIATPVYFSQTDFQVKTCFAQRQAILGGAQYCNLALTPWSVMPSAPFLNIPVLPGANVLDPASTTQPSSSGATQTCWAVQRYDVLADYCMLGTFGCQGVARRLHVSLVSESTRDVFRLYLKEHGPGQALGTMPGPLWFEHDSLVVPSSHDPARCVAVSILTTCKRVHNVSVAVGTGTVSFWIGITGATPQARYVPYRLETRLQ